MTDQEQGFLHSTTQTVKWFVRAMENDELDLAPPFQRNPVWTDAQRSYLIGTILEGYPIPELYLQNNVDGDGNEKHVVVDGQQRIRACLGFVRGEFALTEEELPGWAGATFNDLPPALKKKIYAYKFVIRALPAMSEEKLREIFKRINRNVVALNKQELRHATYWGPFIKMVEKMADDDPYWADCGVFTANDHRRMLDQEFITELVVAHLHGAQNKKDKLDHYYELYEQSFEAKDDVQHAFSKVTAELAQLLPDLAATRWRKKSDFYTLFLVLAERETELPFASDVRIGLADRARQFGRGVDQLLRLEETAWESPPELVARYARSVSRAASDRANRIARHKALRETLFPVERAPSPVGEDEEDPNPTPGNAAHE